MRSTSFWLLLLSSTLATCGYSLLLAVVPLWLAHGGSGAFGAGVSTAVFMLATVLTQLGVPWLMRRLGHRTLLAAALLLLGLPAPLLALSGRLAPVLALSVLRGIGFGLFTVVSNALVAELVGPEEHGRATARFGMSIGVPQLVLLPAGVGLVGHLGFHGVFLAAAAPLLGLFPLPFVRTLATAPAAINPAAINPAAINPAAINPGSAVTVLGDGPSDVRSTAGRPDPVGAQPPVVPDRPDQGPAPGTPEAPVPVGTADADPGDRPGGGRRVLGGLAGPLAGMVTCSVAQGGLITFLPLTAPGAAGGLVVPIALLGSMTGSLAGRLVAGQLVDRRGLGGRMLRPGMLLTGLGMLVELAVVGMGGLGAAVVLAVGAVAVGVGFGLVQNDSLVTMFAAAGPKRYSVASAAWNAAYDAGTGAGALGLGALAEPFGFRAAFGASAGLLALAAPLIRTRRPPDVGGD